MRPPLAADAKLGLINKKEEMIDEIIRNEKNFFILNFLKRVNLNTYLFRN